MKHCKYLELNGDTINNNKRVRLIISMSKISLLFVTNTG